MAHRFNGVDVRTPTSFNWDLKDIEAEESGRTLDGIYHVELIAKKRMISYKWSDPSATEVSTILQLINSSNAVNITYPDALSNTYETRKFRSLKKSAPFRNYRVGAKLYSELTLDFEEL
jgi:hypothetical protein